MKMKHVFIFAILCLLGGCATDLKDEHYIEAMERQDEEAFQRHMGNY